MALPPIPCGLSPRVRGNQHTGSQLRNTRRSIPACAGEPARNLPPPNQGRVYPRVCGGTSQSAPSPARPQGLSPRVRGNRGQMDVPVRSSRSIPACAGEPTAARRKQTATAVYPRVCGGTGVDGVIGRADKGLSPRVRGNPGRAPPPRPRHRSIPACAGEPLHRVPFPQRTRVYPRVCGGTSRLWQVVMSRWGLSPRVRGNHNRIWGCAQSKGSIPACAGEPPGSSSSPRRIRVYPRVCGGTPWPFDNASCYLIRQGNNGDPLAVTYQIHPSASTVSFGYFPQRQYPPHARRRRRPGHWL